MYGHCTNLLPIILVHFLCVANVVQAEIPAMHESPALIQQRAALHQLHAAVRVGDPDAVRLALNAGVDVNQSSALEMAILLEREDIIDLLIERGADVNRPGLGGDLPLTVAVRRGNPELMQRLIERGADTNQKDRRGMTALDHAQRQGQRGTEAVNLLKRNSVRTTESE